MKKPRNIILFCIDTLRYDCTCLEENRPILAGYGVENLVDTPSFGEFTQNGTYFSQAVSQSSYTTSSHAGIFTGYYPQTHNVRPFFKWKLNRKINTLAQFAQKAGYRTTHAAEFPYFGLLGLDKGAGSVQKATDNSLFTSLKKNPTGNYLFYHVFDVHLPYTYSEYYQTGKPAEQYDGLIKTLLEQYKVKPVDKFPYDITSRLIIEEMWTRGEVDEIFKLYIQGVNSFFKNRFTDFIDFLQSNRILDDSLLVIFSDHGEGPNTAHFGHGGDLFEGIIRVPLYLQWDGIFSKSKHIDSQVRLTDIFPTVMECMGMNREIPEDINGESLLGLIDTPGPHRPAYSEVWASTLGEDDNNDHMEESLKNGDIIQRDYSISLYQRSLRAHPWKIVLHGDESQFNFGNDSDNRSFLDQVYKSVLKREPDIQGFNEWLDKLNNNVLSREDVFRQMHETDEYRNSNKLFNIHDDPAESVNRLFEGGPSGTVMFESLKQELDLLVSPKRNNAGEQTGFESKNEAEAVRKHLEGLGYL